MSSYRPDPSYAVARAGTVAAARAAPGKAEAIPPTPSIPSGWASFPSTAAAIDGADPGDNVGADCE